MTLFKNKYRIESARWNIWNYANAGAYFVTICTKDRQQFFGFCENGTMQLNALGKIASSNWNEIPKHFPNARLGEFVVMPNHIHGIIILDTNVGSTVETLHRNVSNQHHSLSIHPPKYIFSLIFSRFNFAEKRR